MNEIGADASPNFFVGEGPDARERPVKGAAGMCAGLSGRPTMGHAGMRGHCSTICLCRCLRHAGWMLLIWYAKRRLPAPLALPALHGRGPAGSMPATPPISPPPQAASLPCLAWLAPPTNACRACSAAAAAFPTTRWSTA